MYGLTFYIRPEDILNKLSEKGKEQFNRCVFTDVEKCKDGSIDISCVLFHDEGEVIGTEYRQRIHFA